MTRCAWSSCGLVFEGDCRCNAAMPAQATVAMTNAALRRSLLLLNGRMLWDAASSGMEGSVVFSQSTTDWSAFEDLQFGYTVHQIGQKPLWLVYSNGKLTFMISVASTPSFARACTRSRKASSLAGKRSHKNRRHAAMPLEPGG